MSVVKKLARKDLWNNTEYQTSSNTQKTKLRLNCNENPWAPENATSPLLNRYPEKQPAALVERLAGLFDVSNDQLLITRGADDGIDALIRSFCQPGQDSVVQCSPAFVMYRFYAQLQAVKVIDIPLDLQAGFGVRFSQLQMQDSSKIFFLCSPNNPTGTTVSANAILEFADKVADRALVVVDEAYVEFSTAGSLATMVENQPNLVVLRTLSKAWSLAGARLGIVLGNSDLIKYLKATTSPYPLSRTSVEAALSATESKHLQSAQNRIQEIVLQRDRMSDELKELDCVEKVYQSDANFLLVKVKSAEKLLPFMLKRGVLLRDQSQQPGLENHIRITVTNAEEMSELLCEFQRFQGAGK